MFNGTPSGFSNTSFLHVAKNITTGFGRAYSLQARIFDIYDAPGHIAFKLLKFKWCRITFMIYVSLGIHASIPGIFEVVAWVKVYDVPNFRFAIRSKDGSQFRSCPPKVGVNLWEGEGCGRLVRWSQASGVAHHTESKGGSLYWSILRSKMDAL